MNVIVLAGDKKNKGINKKEGIINDEVISNVENNSTQYNKYLDNGIDNKALIKIKDKYMIEYVIDTLRKSNMFEKIALVGPTKKLEPIVGDKVNYILEGTDSIVRNTLLAVEYFKEDKEVLIVTSDIPMITVEALEDFVNKAKSKKADLCYPIVNKKINDERFPEIKRTYARLREGKFTGGNVFMFNPKVTNQCKDFVEKMLEYRKSPAKMAKVFGIGFLLKFATGLLTLQSAEKKCGKLLGIKASVVISEYPEIGNDVDKPSDVEFVLRYL